MPWTTAVHARPKVDNFNKPSRREEEGVTRGRREDRSCDYDCSPSTRPLRNSHRRRKSCRLYNAIACGTGVRKRGIQGSALLAQELITHRLNLGAEGER